MIYFFYGPNDFMIKRKVSVVSRDFTTKHGKESITKLNVADGDINKLLASIVNIDMFAPRRLVVIENPITNKSLWMKIGEYLTRIPEGTDLIVAESNPDKRTKTFKDLKKQAKSQEFPQLRYRDLDEWTLLEAQDLKVELSKDGLNELVMRTGGDQWRISSEIAKFSMLPGKVDARKVREIVEPNIDASAFTLLDCALNGRLDNMLEEFDMLRRLEDANKFLGLLTSQVFALTVAVSAKEDIDIKSDGDIAREVGIHPFVMQKVSTVAKKLCYDDIRKLAKNIAETDMKVKTSGAIDAWSHVELALVRVAR